MRYDIKISQVKSRSKYGGVLLTFTCGEYRSRASGGGYDMIGMCLAHLVQDMMPEFFGADSPFTPEDIPNYYGLNQRTDGTWFINGACGDDCVGKIIRELMGFTVSWEWTHYTNGDRKKLVGCILESSDTPSSNENI